MLDRRAFVHGSAALVAALTRWPPAVSGGVDEAAAVAGPRLAIADTGLDGSRAFVERVRANGSQPFEFASDVAGLWMRELEPRLRSAPVAIMGYTSAATLFCLDLLARDYGARIVERRASRGAVSWVLSSSPARRAALAPPSSHWRQPHA
jgi:hypothetical protein